MSELTEHAVNGVDPRPTLLGFGSSSTTVTGSVGAHPGPTLTFDSSGLNPSAQYQHCFDLGLSQATGAHSTCTSNARDQCPQE